jgi:hypothetical protein
MDSQEQFPDTGGITINLASQPIKNVACRNSLRRVREYVETMHRAGRKAEVIRLKKDDYEAFLREITKKRSKDAPKIVGLHWDGIPVAA